MQSVCVFCGASHGNKPIFSQQAHALGRFIAKQGWTLVYGGAQIGLMGTVADGALEAGGEVVGVLPRFLQVKEIAHEGLSELVLVESMHERKLEMHERSDAVVALPGGFGTLEELMEIMTWAQLGLHQKPMGLLNTDGYYSPLLQLFQQMVNSGLLREQHLEMLQYSDSIPELFQRLQAYQSSDDQGFLTKVQT